MIWHWNVHLSFLQRGGSGRVLDEGHAECAQLTLWQRPNLGQRAGANHSERRSVGSGPVATVPGPSVEITEREHLRASQRRMMVSGGDKWQSFCRVLPKTR